MNPETFCGAINCHCDRVSELVAKNTRLTAENEKAKELLKELEWIENELGGWFCPICIGERLIGHKSDCKLSLAINGKEARK